MYDIDTKAAIMVNKIGKIEVATSSWQLLFYYDMQAYFDVIKQLEDFLEKFRLVCEKMGDFNDYCDSFGTTIRTKIDNIKEKHKILRHRTNRKKRFILFFDIGNSNRIQENMQTIIKNKKHLMECVDNQTSVINATEELVRATTIEANRNLGKLTQEVNIIAETMKEHFMVYKQSIKFLILSNQVRNWIEDAESLQGTAISMITYISEERIACNKMLEELEKKTKINTKTNATGWKFSYTITTDL